MIALADFHHSQLFQSFQHLFEHDLGIELYRPLGAEWYHKGFYYHPIEEEALGILTKTSEFDPSKHKNVFDAPDGVLWKNGEQYCVLYRWMPLERVREIDYLICTQERNEEPFYRLKKEMGLKCKVLRYCGNGGEPVDLSKCDILISALLEHYERYIRTGQKPGLLFHPWFDLNNSMFCYSEMPAQPPSILRQLLNFSFHHREPGGPYETWMRYCGYCQEIGARHHLHGLGTPPPGIEVPMDKIIDESFRAMGREDLLDRSKWPDLLTHDGEPPNLRMLATLIKESHAVLQPKRSPPEGFGYLVHEVAACGRPLIVPHWYKQLSAALFLQERETCLFITGHDPTDKENLHWLFSGDNAPRMGREIRRRFDHNVNFDDEARRIKELL